MDERTSLLSAVGVALMVVACGGAVDSGPSGQDENGIGNCDDCGDGEGKSSGGTASTSGSGAGGSTPSGTGGEHDSVRSDRRRARAPAGPRPGRRRHRSPVRRLSAAEQQLGEHGQRRWNAHRSRADLTITFGSQKPLCEAPFESGGCGNWKVAFGLPPELLKPGVLELADARLNSYSSFSGPDRGGGDCYGGGGASPTAPSRSSAWTKRRSWFDSTNTWTYDFDANGEHTIDRCD